MTPNASYENTRVANSEIDSENVDDLNVTWTQPLTGSGSVRGFRLHAAHQRGRRRLRAGPRLERHGVRPGDGRAAVEGRVRRADARAERPRPRGRGPLRRDQRRRVRARRRVRRGGLEEAGPRVRLRGRGGPEPRLHDPAGGPGRRPAPVRGRQGRRWACARVRCEDGRAALVLRHHGRAPGRRHGFGRRLEHAARRRRGQRLLLGRERLLLAERTEEHAERTPLHEQSREARRRDRRAPLVLPGPSERLLGLGSAPLARARGLGRRRARGDRREARVRHRRRPRDRRGGLEDAVGTHNGHDDDSRKQLDGTLELPRPRSRSSPARTVASRRTSRSTRARSTLRS